MGRQAKRIEGEILTDVEKAVGKLFIKVGQALTSITPVDIGFARAGWTPSTGRPETAELKAPSALSRTAQKQLAAKRFSKSRAAGALIGKTYRLGLGKAYWTNPVVYIVPLNAGSSSQAPANFVERAIAAAVKSARL